MLKWPQYEIHYFCLFVGKMYNCLHGHMAVWNYGHPGQKVDVFVVIKFVTLKGSGGC